MNPLFNVVNAYSHFDPEIEYCQGICFIVALILKHMEDEDDTFFVLIHVMKVHGWRGIYACGAPKMQILTDFLVEVLETGYNPIFEHIMDEFEISIIPAFQSNIQTIFVYDCPEKMATTVFDVFLLDGEQVIFTLLIKMLELQEEKIKATEGEELLNYLRSIMPADCLKQYPMTTLLD